MNAFSDQIISWQKTHGRHNLPWQNTVDPYAIWVSEIMLQQTQVTAVIGYYAKFMLRFPSIEKLANATQEQVLQHWSGLGYYSRARNMHNAAQKIVDDFNGVFPQRFDDIYSLPGIGRTTAAAISTFALNTPYPILDGNVKRVFARHFNIAGYTATPKVAEILWQIAERENPSDANKNKSLKTISDAISYTQGLMDLGATICTRSKPKCSVCPVNSSCLAFAYNIVNTLPTPKPRKVLPEKSVVMLVLISNNEVMLEKRAPIGIWGGLWSLPEVLEGENAYTTILNSNDIKQNTQDIILDQLTHTFTHFKLHITPLLVYSTKSLQVSQSATIWLPIDDAIDAAIPTPIRKILMALKTKMLEIKND